MKQEKKEVYLRRAKVTNHCPIRPKRKKREEKVEWVRKKPYIQTKIDHLAEHAKRPI